MVNKKEYVQMNLDEKEISKANQILAVALLKRIYERGMIPKKVYCNIYKEYILCGWK